MNMGKDWVRVTSKKEQKKESDSLEEMGNKPYLSKNGGISIVYEKGNPSQTMPTNPTFTFSSKKENSLDTNINPNNKNPNPSPLASHKTNQSGENAPNTDLYQNKDEPIEPISTPETTPTNNNNTPTPCLTTTLGSKSLNKPHTSILHQENIAHNDITLSDISTPNQAHETSLTPNDEADVKAAGVTPLDVDGLLEPGVENMTENTNGEFIMDEDDLLDEEENKIIDENEEQAFTEEEMNALINSDAEIEGDEEDFSGDSYHSISTANTKQSSSSMINKLSTMKVHNSVKSTSESSKRKLQGGEEEATTSTLMGNKKPRV